LSKRREKKVITTIIKDKAKRKIILNKNDERAQRPKFKPTS
jgi:hypothetical protein